MERYRYDAYGAATVLDADGSDDSDGISDVENPYAFTARRLDLESDLMYYRNRQYSVILGRFISRDPEGYADWLNLYCYVAGVVTRRTDAFGLVAVEVEPASPMARAVVGILSQSMPDNLKAVSDMLDNEEPVGKCERDWYGCLEQPLRQAEARMDHCHALGRLGVLPARVVEIATDVGYGAACTIVGLSMGGVGGVVFAVAWGGAGGVVLGHAVKGWLETHFLWPEELECMKRVGSTFRREWAKCMALKVLCQVDASVARLATAEAEQGVQGMQLVACSD